MTAIDGILLDTYAVLRVMEGDGTTTEGKREIDDAALRGSVLVSPISAWEIGISFGRDGFR